MGYEHNGHRRMGQKVCHWVLGLWLLAGVGSAAHSARSISLPHSESFNTSASISDLRWVTQGGALTWEANGGWQGGGGIKIIPTLVEGYAGIGEFNGFAPQTRLNVRWLIWFGNSYQRQLQSAKMLILHRQNIMFGFQRPMIMDDERVENGQVQRYFFPAVGYGNGPLEGQDRFHVSGNEYANQWVCFEFEADLPNKRLNMYVFTQDRRYSGLSNSLDMVPIEEVRTGRHPQEFPITAVQGLGFYWGNPVSELGVSPELRDAQAFVKYDELVIDNRYIGCPAGFLSNPPPSAPQNLR